VGRTAVPAGRTAGLVARTAAVDGRLAAMGRRWTPKTECRPLSPGHRRIVCRTADC